MLPYSDDIYSNVKNMLQCRTQYIKNKKNIEFEARMGIIDVSSGKFSPGCSKEDMENLLGKFERAQCGTFEVSGWEESCDTFFHAPGISSQVRATSWGDSEKISYNCVNVVKTCISKIDTVSKQTPSLSWRIVLNIEQQLLTENLPTFVKPLYVRIKQRRSFTYMNPDKTVSWRYDLTLTWSGKNKHEAEKSQITNEPKYEFEIELVYAHDDVSIDYLTESMLLKMCDHLSDLKLAPSLSCVNKRQRTG